MSIILLHTCELEDTKCSMLHISHQDHQAKHHLQLYYSTQSHGMCPSLMHHHHLSLKKIKHNEILTLWTIDITQQSKVETKKIILSV